MAYLRFLNDNDYIAVATKEHMEQLIRDNHDRIPEAEARAETKFYEHLDQYYEIDKLFAVGKNIREYDSAITYPANIWILKDGEVYKTLKGVNGIKRPTKVVYWKHITEIISPMIIERAKKYSQLGTWAKGAIVRFGTEHYECLVPNGFEMGNVQLPGPRAWQEAEVTPWEPNMDWKVNEVCSFNGNFYQFLGPEDEPVEEPEEPSNQENEGEEEEEGQEPSSEPSTDPSTELSNEPNSEPQTQNEPPVDPFSSEPSNEPGEPSTEPGEGEEEEEEEEEPSANEPEAVLNPEEDDRWGLIGDYTDEYEYTWDQEGEFDYVVAEGAVFYPVMNPNAEALIENVNIVRDDPRHTGVKQHMLNLAVYYLHMIISPTNVSETRRWAYEESIAWLYNASKFKINPHIPRKKDKDSHLPKVDWALETFQRDYDPNQNPWLI